MSPLNLDVSGVSEGIIGEGPPAQMNEEHIDGLTQEISHLQVDRGDFMCNVHVFVVYNWVIVVEICISINV